MNGAAAQESQPARILIVEDEGIVARDLEQTLNSLGYEVTGMASSGAEALELASLVATDLILMDVRIRGNIDGIETADQVRQHLGIPVVFLTAHADGSTLKRANRTEPYGYVVKPFTPSDISVAIELALNRHGLVRKLKRQEAWFSTVLNSIGDAVIALDFDGDIRFMNIAAEELTGWTLPECLGKTLEEGIYLCLCIEDEPGSDAVLPNIAPRPAANRSHGFIQNRQGQRIRVTVVSSEIAMANDGTQQGRVLVLRSDNVPGSENHPH